MLFLFRKSKADKSNTAAATTAHKHKHKHTRDAGAWGDCSADGGWEGKVACGSKEAGGCGSGCGGGCGGGGCGGGEFVASGPQGQ